MTIKENQISKIESLILEGEITMCSSPKGKWRYIDTVKKTIENVCHENGEQEPDWVYFSIPTVSFGNEEQTEQNVRTYYIELLPFIINMLRELRSGYYLRRQLEESHKQTLEACSQTHEAEMQTKEATKANKKTNIALWLSGIAVLVSIFAFVVSTCTRTIKFDDSQYKEIKSVICSDNVNSIQNKSKYE